MVKDQEIPIIDLAPLSGPYGEISKDVFENIAEQFGSAMHNVGFAYVINHGVDIKKVDYIHELSKKLFTQPQEVKLKYRKKKCSKKLPRLWWTWRRIVERIREEFH